MRCPWLHFAQVRAAERCKAESNLAMVISNRVSKSKANFENLTKLVNMEYGTNGLFGNMLESIGISANPNQLYITIITAVIGLLLILAI